MHTVTNTRALALSFAFALLAIARIAAAEVLEMTHITLTVGDLARTEAFYRDALGFERVSRRTIDDPAWAQLVGVEDAHIDSILMRLGEEQVEFQQYARDGRPYPVGSRSPDLWFQHFAIVVSDMDAAWTHLARFAPQLISRSGPQTLPEQNEHVRALKFRDPDGHPLELLYFPRGTGPERWRDPATGRVFLGIDHSAIAIASTPASLAFYSGLLGLASTYAVTNRGPTQVALDDTFNAVVEITGLRPASESGPGVEFLEYRVPRIARQVPPDSAASDIAHAHMVFAVHGLDELSARLWAARVDFVSPGVVRLDSRRHGFAAGLMVRDPDGHALLLAE